MRDETVMTVLLTIFEYRHGQDLNISRAVVCLPPFC